MTDQTCEDKFHCSRTVNRFYQRKFRAINVSVSKYEEKYKIEFHHQGWTIPDDGSERSRDEFLKSSTVTNATNELITCTVLFCADLMPKGIYADFLQEQRPELEEISDFLREWESLYSQGLIDEGR